MKRENYIEISLFIGEFPCLKAYWKGIVVTIRLHQSANQLFQLTPVLLEI